ncbi:hypothetical protein [Rhizobium anhuiense]|uniref:hypothetical protein n=1 Tax=Rhizobium anhuiense TaxID=1184720 RepID=UPI00117B5C28|nr:hypothetical protein [Rhizobium anhuiense]
MNTAKKAKQPLTHPTAYRTIDKLPGYLFGDDGCIVSTRLLKDTDRVPWTDGSLRIRMGKQKDAPRIERIKRTVYQGYLSANLRITKADGQRVCKSFRVATLMCAAWHGERPSPKARGSIIDATAEVTPANVEWKIPAPVKRGARPSTTQRNAELIALHKHGLRDAEIAARTGIPLSTVSRSIAPQRETIRPRGIGATLDLAHILRLYARGTRQADIARTLSVKRKVINRLITKAKAQGLVRTALPREIAEGFQP